MSDGRTEMLMKKWWLNNKTVIVTGASGGIGRGITIRLIKEYNCTVFAIARNEEKMRSLAKELGSDANKLSYRLFDISAPDNRKSYAPFLISRT